MKKGTLVSIVIALIAVAGALLGLVAYMRSRRCLECGDVEEDYVPDAQGDYDMEYYVDDRPEAVSEAATFPEYVSAPVDDTSVEGDDITE